MVGIELVDCVQSKLLTHYIIALAFRWSFLSLFITTAFCAAVAGGEEERGRERIRSGVRHMHCSTHHPWLPQL